MWRVRLERALERALDIVMDLNLIVQLGAGAVLVVLMDLFFLIRAREGWTMNPSWLMVAIPLGVTLLWGNVAFLVILRWWWALQKKGRGVDVRLPQ